MTVDDVARKHGPAVRVVLDVGLIAGLIWGGMMIERASRQLNMLVVHMCRLEVLTHQQSFDVCIADFGPAVKFDPRALDPH